MRPLIADTIEAGALMSQEPEPFHPGPLVSGGKWYLRHQLDEFRQGHPLDTEMRWALFNVTLAAFLFGAALAVHGRLYVVLCAWFSAVSWQASVGTLCPAAGFIALYRKLLRAVRGH